MEEKCSILEIEGFKDIDSANTKMNTAHDTSFEDCIEV